MTDRTHIPGPAGELVDEALALVMEADANAGKGRTVRLVKANLNEAGKLLKDAAKALGAKEAK